MGTGINGDGGRNLWPTPGELLFVTVFASAVVAKACPVGGPEAELGPSHDLLTPLRPISGFALLMPGVLGGLAFAGPLTP